MNKNEICSMAQLLLEEKTDEDIIKFIVSNNLLDEI